MRDDTPTVYLLAGAPGSGKTTYARALEQQGVVRLATENETLDQVNDRLVAHVEAGRDVVLDHGLGDREERDFYKKLVEEHGGQWCLINLTVDHTELIRRLEERVAGEITPDMLAWMASTQERAGDGVLPVQPSPVKP